MSFYISPGMPAPPPQASQPNAYIQPSGPLQQSPPPSPQPAPESPQARDQEPLHGTLFTEWRAHHGNDWVRADGLAPAVRRMVDERERVPAIRQKLPKLASTHFGGFKLESKVVGNAARPVTLYRAVESESAGLEG